jgi:hypothetical protein
MRRPSGWHALLQVPTLTRGERWPTLSAAVAVPQAREWYREDLVGWGWSARCAPRFLVALAPVPPFKPLSLVLATRSVCPSYFLPPLPQPGVRACSLVTRRAPPPPLPACSGIKREHLFISSKVHPRHLGYWSTLDVRPSRLKWLKLSLPGML